MSQERASIAPPRATRDRWLIVSFCTLLLPYLSFVAWQLFYVGAGDTITFGMLSLLLTIGWLGWVIACASSVFWRWKSRRATAFAPLLITLCVLPIWLFADGTSLWLRFNYWYYAETRAEFVDRVRAGEIFPMSVSYGADTVKPDVGTYLAIEGGEVWIKKTAKGMFVLFPTFFGIPDGFSGFLYAPGESNPRADWAELSLEWADPWDPDRNVYFVGNR